MAILLIDAGGTISSRPGEGGALVECPAADMAGLPDLPAGVVMIVERAYAGLSENMDFSDMTSVARAVLDGQARADVDGIVVAHGADIMEECAYLCDLVTPCAKPVVFTGAQRAPGAPDFDGATNLRDAVAVAQHPMAASLGVLIAFGSRIIPAVHAYKCHTSALAAFAGHGANVGSVAGDAVRLPQSRTRPAPLVLCEAGEDVVLLKLTAAMPARLIEAVTAAGYRALVIEGLGAGNAPDAVVEAVAAACMRELTVAIGTRCPGGESGGAYDSGRRLMAAGALSCGRLPAVQARILLCLLFAEGRQPDDIAQTFKWHVTSLTQTERGASEDAA
ncbi:asparaginase [Novosphingobium rosa]|uniref:asparaginase n=1 Tax=Novosphingobium rosa TaxID=76978 RepID=UPI00082A159B|nr:asparaginase domain-containing protein [Novosphingobium rosa]